MAERLDKIGLSRLWRATQIKLLGLIDSVVSNRLEQVVTDSDITTINSGINNLDEIIGSSNISGLSYNGSDPAVDDITTHLNSISTGLNNLASDVGDIWSTATYTCRYSVAAGSTTSITGNDLGVSTPNGYSPVAIVNVATGNSKVGIGGWQAKGTGGSSVVSLINTGSSAVTDSTCSVEILYIRSSSTI